MFFLPWMPKVLFGLPWLMLQNFTDGVFYLGYALHFRELVDRVGLNYYAVRFSGIFPDALAFSVFGPETGLVLMRYGLAGACCVALFVCFQKRYSAGAGVLAAVAWALNPAAIRFLQTAYVDVTAASFLCLGLALACLPGLGALGAAGSGMLFSLAFWGHLHAAVALVFCGPLVLLALWEQGAKRAVVLAGWIFAGFLVPALAAAAFYFQQFGLWDLTSPTRELLNTLREGHIPAPKLEWIAVVRQCPFWLAGAPLAIGLVFLTRKDRFLYGSFFAFAGYIVFLLWGDLAKGGYSLSLFYYFSFALPAFVFLVAALIGNLLAGGMSWRSGVPLAASLCFPVLAIGWNLPGGAWTAGGSVLAASGLSWLPGAGQRFQTAAVSLAIGFSVILVAIAPSSRLALGNYWKGDDLPVLTAARELAEILPAYREKPAGLAFWFDDADGSDLRMLQSFYLHEFTKWKDASGRNVPFPARESDIVHEKWSGGGGDLVILAKSPEELLGILQRAPAIVELSSVVQRFQVPAASPMAYGAVLTFSDPEFSRATSLMDRIEFHRKTRKPSDSLAGFETGRRKWNPDAVIPLPDLAQGRSVRLRMQVLRGAVVVDLEGKGQSAIAPIVVSPSVVPAVIFLRPPPSMENARLRIRNFSPHGVRSRARIDDISMVDSAPE